jgi:Uma2 family endonuclease
MSSAVKILPHYTYEDYCQWEGRWELLDGIPFAMSPAPTPAHQWVSSNVKGELRNAIKKAGCKHCKVYDFVDVKITEDTIVQPDALVVCKPIDKKFLDFPPALVVEVLSPATVLKDRNSKFYLYEAQKIPYYLIVDIDKKEVEIYRLNETGQYVLDAHDPLQPYTFTLDGDCTAQLSTAGIWD